MNDKNELVVEERDVEGKKVRRLRAQGLVPGTIYGGRQPSRSVQVERTAIEQLLRRGAGTAILQLKVGNGRPGSALIKQMQLDPITGELLHIDFFRVAEREKLKAKVPLRFVGEAPVTKVHDVVINRPVAEVTVECLPADLPRAIDVDLSGLTETHSTIRLGDLHLGDRITVTDQPDLVLASVSVTSKEAVEAEEEAEAAEAAAEARAEAGASEEEGNREAA